MKRYVIRKLGAEVWVDLLHFKSETFLIDAIAVIKEKISSGEIKVYGQGVYCLIEQKSNGREWKVGKNVSISRDGTFSYV